MIVYLVLIALVSYRLWRLAAIDQITEPLRSPLIRSDSRVAGWALDLIGCPWCLGFWICGAVSAAVGVYADWSLLDALLVWWASSALVGLLGRLDAE